MDKQRSNEIVFNLKGYYRKDEVATGCVSYCPSLNIFSHGKDSNDARDHLWKAVRLYLETRSVSGNWLFLAPILDAKSPHRAVRHSVRQLMMGPLPGLAYSGASFYNFPSLFGLSLSLYP